MPRGVSSERTGSEATAATIVEADGLTEWDLSDLYASPEDPALATDVARLQEEAAAFEERVRGSIAVSEPSAATIRAALDDYERLLRDRALPSAYAGLRFAADAMDPQRGAHYQRTRLEHTAFSRHLIFFPLELARIPEETFRRLVEDPLLADYRHYLQQQRIESAYYLSEPEEKIVAELETSGSDAFTRLYSELGSRSRYRLTLRGEEKELTQSELLSLLYDADRDVRRAAAASFTEGLRGHSHVLTFIYNTLLQEKATMDRLRGYTFAEQQRHLSNEVDSAVVHALEEVVTSAYGIVHDYYDLKRRLLGLEEQTHYDRYAPTGESRERIPFAEARDVVLESFGAFDPRVRELIAPFFERGWIDAELRPGKRGGAFCSYITPNRHPYVFMNYTGKPRDVMTLAHELGHALHGILASRNHYLHFYPSLAMAETASVFGEMLVFERLQERLHDPRERLALLTGKIEDTFATVFRQMAIYRFEQHAHAALRKSGEQTAEAYGELWQAAMQEMFGSSLRLGEDHALWWTSIPHIYHSPFYVYAYAFGELMVMGLYSSYRQQGEPFVDRYLELLARGSSASPAELVGDMGIEIGRRDFWESGTAIIRGMVDQARALAEETGAVDGRCER